MKWLSITLFFFLICSPLVLGKEIVKNASIPLGGNEVWTIPALDVGENQKVLLSLEARVDHKTFGGSWYAIGVWVNGARLDKSALINKPDQFQLISGTTLNWFGSGANGSGWRALYSPDFDSGKDRNSAASLVEAPLYEFVFDITEFIWEDQKNYIGLLNILSTSVKDALKGDVSLIVRNMEVRIVDNEHFMGYLPPTSEVKVLERLVKPHNSSVDFEFELGSGGGFTIYVGGERYVFESVFSYPNLGWNSFLIEGKDDTSEPSWHISLKDYMVEADGMYYTVTRRIEVFPNRVDVCDTFKNLDKEKTLGIIIKNRLVKDAPDELFFRGLRVYGDNISISEPANPSLFLKRGKSSVGIIAVDDVFRVHSLLFKEGDSVGISDKNFGLAPGNEYTIVWSVYPGEDGDYFDFINKVRDDWKVNFTLNGFAFFYPGRSSWQNKSLQEIEEFLDYQGVSIVSTGIPIKDKDRKYAHGSAFIHEAKESQELFKRVTEELHSVRPDIKVVPYIHLYISTETDGIVKYSDAKYLDSKGVQIDYPYEYSLPLFIPLEDNEYGKRLYEYLDIVMDQLGMDGLYIDEFPYSVTPFVYDAPWDGHSVDISPVTYQVVREKSSIPLLTQEFKVNFIERIFDKGGVIIANFAPVTKRMSGFHFPRFVETGSITALVKTHLYSPVGLGDAHSQYNEEDVIEKLREHLEYGALYYYYNINLSFDDNVLQNIYPFTPIELHQGYLIGEERIITTRSGVFGWGDASNIESYLYDPKGRLISNDFELLQIEGENFVKVNLALNEIAILVRK